MSEIRETIHFSWQVNFYCYWLGSDVYRLTENAAIIYFFKKLLRETSLGSYYIKIRYTYYKEEHWCTQLTMGHSKSVFFQNFGIDLFRFNHASSRETCTKQHGL